MAGRPFDDRVQPGHVACRLQNLLFIGLGDGRLQAAQFAEAVEKAVGDTLEFLHGPRQHRIGRGARGQRAQHRLAQQEDLGKQFGTRLIDVAVNQVLQPAGFAFEPRQDLVGLADLPHILPRRAQHLGAVPDQRGEHDDDRGIERRDRQDAPADRDCTEQTDDAHAGQCSKARRPVRRLALLARGQGSVHSALRMRSIRFAVAGSRRAFS